MSHVKGLPLTEMLEMHKKATSLCRTSGDKLLYTDTHTILSLSLAYYFILCQPVAMKKNMSPRIPEPSGQYQITHLLLRHVLFFYLRGTSVGLTKVCLWKGNIPEFTDSGSWQRSFSPFTGRNPRVSGTEGIWKTIHWRLVMAIAWCSVPTSTSFSAFPFLPCVAKLGSDATAADPAPDFTWREGGATWSSTLGKKIRKRSHVSWSVRVFAYRNFFDGE